MLKKQFRLNLRNEAGFFLNCKKIHNPQFSFLYLPGETFKATIVVSKKVSSLATKRNAVKRKFSQALQELLKDFEKTNIKLVIVVHGKSLELSLEQIVQQINKNVQKIRI